MNLIVLIFNLISSSSYMKSRSIDDNKFSVSNNGLNAPVQVYPFPL